MTTGDSDREEGQPAVIVSRGTVRSYSDHERNAERFVGLNKGVRPLYCWGGGGDGTVGVYGER